MEERLTQLESAQAVLNKIAAEQLLRLREIEHNETMLLGIVRDQERDIKAIQGDVSSIKERLDRIEERLTAEFTSIQQQLATIVAMLKKESEG